MNILFLRFTNILVFLVAASVEIYIRAAHRRTEIRCELSTITVYLYYIYLSYLEDNKIKIINWRPSAYGAPRAVFRIPQNNLPPNLLWGTPSALPGRGTEQGCVGTGSITGTGTAGW